MENELTLFTLEPLNTKNKYTWFTEDELKERAYTFTFVLYDDSTTYNYHVIIERLNMLSLNKNEFKYAYIVHNKEDVKKHTHLLVKFKYQHSIKSVLDIFDLQEYNPHSDVDNMGVVVKSIKSMLKYFCHLDKRSKELGKYEYPTDDIISNIENIVNNIKNKEEYTDIFLNIIDYINTMEGYVTLKSVIDYCRSQDINYMYVLCDKKFNFMITQSIRERNIVNNV